MPHSQMYLVPRGIERARGRYPKKLWIWTCTICARDFSTRKILHEHKKTDHAL